MEYDALEFQISWYRDSEEHLKKVKALKDIVPDDSYKILLDQAEKHLKNSKQRLRSYLKKYSKPSSRMCV